MVSIYDNGGVGEMFIDEICVSSKESFGEKGKPKL